MSYSNPQRRLRPLPTPETLQSAALAYLARYAASEATVRRVLMARVHRAARQHPDFAADEARQADLATAIEGILKRFRSAGFLNDATFAETKAGSLRRRGQSRRLIAEKLKAEGIERATIEAAMSAADEDRPGEEADLEAARLLARRRKLGPWRTAPIPDLTARFKADRRDAGVLARAGFSGSIIRKVLGGSIEDMDDFDG
jgi:regulatory protein